MRDLVALWATQRGRGLSGGAAGIISVDGVGKVSLWGGGGMLDTCHADGEAPNQTFWNQGAAPWGLPGKEKSHGSSA